MDGRNEGVGRRGAAIGVTLAAFLLAGSAGAAGAADRTAIGIFRAWGAFREGPADAPLRCYAIAEPPPDTASAGRGAFASVASWPARRVRAQFAMRLSRDVPTAAGTLAIGDARFALIVRGRDAWARDRRADAAIVAAMRSGSSMSVSAVGADAAPFADVYRLRGAASAIDAAALACPPR